MQEENSATFNIGKALMEVSLPTIAAIGSATGNVWIAGATALPAAVAASGNLRSLFNQEEQFGLPRPPWWTSTPEAWQNACNRIENRFPSIMDAVAKRLQQAQGIPTTQTVRQAFVDEITHQLPEWDVRPQDRGLMAETITPSVLKKSAEAINKAIDPIRNDAFAQEMQKIAHLFDKVSTEKSKMEEAVTSPSLAVVNTGTAVTQEAQQQQAVAMLRQKIQQKKYDAFICYNQADQSEAMKLGNQLKDLGILPWLDEWEARPGVRTIDEERKQIANINSAAVLVGKSGIAKLQQMLADAFLNQFIQRGVFLIPVFLEDAPQEPLPIFLDGFSCVDFRKKESAPMERLIWGITGERPQF